MTPERCAHCGRFVSFSKPKATLSYVPYGGYQDLEPPGEEFICQKCYEAQDGEARKLLERTTYWTPTWVNTWEPT
jgi:hypothetical protein